MSEASCDQNRSGGGAVNCVVGRVKRLVCLMGRKQVELVDMSRSPEQPVGQHHG